jgi:Putative auto-transporter adhesin, head GIN domain
VGVSDISGVITTNRPIMKKIALATFVFCTLLLSSCLEEDPGPRQSDSRTYAITDFDRIAAGDALIITIKQGNNFSIQADGDRRNLDDLMIYKTGSTLVVRYGHYEKRQYNTSINITLPVLFGGDFSSAVNANISGFTYVTQFDLSLSGASLAQLDIEAAEFNFALSGASQLRLNGKGQIINGTITGASLLSAFYFPSAQAKLIVSGASNGKVNVSQQLEVNASGASLVLYRGNPQVEVEVSGESVVKQE